MQDQPIIAAAPLIHTSSSQIRRVNFQNERPIVVLGQQLQKPTEPAVPLLVRSDWRKPLQMPEEKPTSEGKPGCCCTIM